MNELEDLYKLINQAQFSKAEVKFSTSREDEDMVENLLRDAGLDSRKTVFKSKVNFAVKASKKLISDLEVQYNMDFLDGDDDLFKL